jgi:hypothetical protein
MLDNARARATQNASKTSNKQQKVAGVDEGLDDIDDFDEDDIMGVEDDSGDVA